MYKSRSFDINGRFKRIQPMKTFCLCLVETYNFRYPEQNTVAIT